jgi:hypothetical protein
MLPLIVVFAVLAASIGYVLAADVHVSARAPLHDAWLPASAS